MKPRRLVRIRKSWQFRKILKKGLTYRGSVIRARFTGNTLGRIRLGFSVSAKTGCAAERNLFKRRLRQYSVETVPTKGYDAVIFPMEKLTGIRWRDMKKDMDQLTEDAGRRLEN